MRERVTYIDRSKIWVVLVNGDKTVEVLMTMWHLPSKLPNAQSNAGTYHIQLKVINLG